MKKILALVLALALALCCAAAFAEEETETRTPDGQYVFHNQSNLVVTQISLIDNDHPERVATISMEGGLQPDQSTGELGLFLMEGEDGKAGLALQIEFENGEMSIYPTVHYEKVLIEILPPVDANSGATPIAFVAYPQFGNYVIKNATGGDVTDLTISHNNGSASSVTALLPADDEFTIGFSIPADADKEHCLTLSYKLADGTVQKYENLSIEDVTITLLAADAITGATPIAFSPYPAE